MTFPNDFLWGAASAAYQVEGATREGGRGHSVWDMMTRNPQRTYLGHNGDVACDHYHRYEEDVMLMQTIGMRAYRFSIAWSRVIPEGTGQVNREGLGFYDRLVDKLLEANIKPFATLFHWDYPYALHCRGGWLNPDSPQWFADYTAVIMNALSDRVQYWFTLNEPQVFVNLGYLEGSHAPGDKLNLPEVLRVAHHALLAHGRSVQAIRETSKQPAHIGAASVGIAFAPATNHPNDIEAARTRTFEHKYPNVWSTAWFCDPIFFGHYPEDGLRVFGHHMPRISERDMEIISQPIDFFGCNIYHTFGHVHVEDDGSITVTEPSKVVRGYPQTNMQWPVTPEALYWGPRFFYERYQKYIIVSENGIATDDWKTLSGDVQDYLRIDFLARYLMALRHAIADGVDVRGYMLWSIMDNFEWAEGYRPRFGIIHVDYATQERTLKASALWYKDVIESNGGTLPQGDYSINVR